MRISDWSSDVCSSDLAVLAVQVDRTAALARVGLHEHRDRQHLRGLARPAVGHQFKRVACGQRMLQTHAGLVLVRRLAGVEVQRAGAGRAPVDAQRSEEHTSELQSLMRISYAVFCLKKKNTNTKHKLEH